MGAGAYKSVWLAFDVSKGSRSRAFTVVPETLALSGLVSCLDRKRNRSCMEYRKHNSSVWVATFNATCDYPMYPHG